MIDTEKTKDQIIKKLVKIRNKLSNSEAIQAKQFQVEKKLQQSYKKLQHTLEDIIEVITKVVEIRDLYLVGHQEKVSKLATKIAQEMGLSTDKIEGIRISSLVHDIGKISIPTEILHKPNRLIDIELNLIKNHPKIAYDILKTIDFPWPIAGIILQHHEMINGSGYPNKLKSNEILIEAKIIAVADVIEAMSSNRPYRPAHSIEEALEEISKNKGILYDPEVADVCITLFKEKGFEW
jgi:HD-GYP domain-containing protein (c-di-GMP phosphodiesterase class II)